MAAEAVPVLVSTPSIASYTPGSGGKKTGLPELDFNLEFTKEKVLRDLGDGVPSIFKRFYLSRLYDNLLSTFILYFVAIFQSDNLKKAVERAKKLQDGVSPAALHAQLADLEREIEAHKRGVGPLYAEILMKHANHQKPQRDRLFFEHLYETLVSILEAAFAKVNGKALVHREIGFMFRSRHFNMQQRKQQPTRSVDTLSVKELYSIKHETSNRALNAKLLYSLYEKPATLGVQVASWSNTPLISAIITSPITARSTTKSPEARSEMARSLQLQSAPRPLPRPAAGAPPNSHLEGGSYPAPLRPNPSLSPAKPSPHSLTPESSTAANFRQPSLFSGAGTPERPASSSSSLPSPSKQLSLVSQPSLTSSKSFPRGPPGGLRIDTNLSAQSLTDMPSAAAGLFDEGYFHLELLKRLMLYGPTFGFQDYTAGPLSRAAGPHWQQVIITSALNPGYQQQQQQQRVD